MAEGQTVTIYTLAHPITGEVFYVGRTTMPILRRLHSHTVDAECSPRYTIYMYELQKAGLRPKIEAVDSCVWEERKNSEEFWIQTFSSWGFPLTNVKHLKNKNWEGYKEKQRKRQRSFVLKTIDQDTLELIRILYNANDCLEIAISLGCHKERIRGMMDKFIRLKSKKLMEWVKDTIENFYLNKGKFISDAYLKTIKNV